eukprot:TRINITY_DN778005_c0_g1_i1.p1 TRINITY_DN778005_c0_g1~~TRINITY_DN778005_c0_g1_i1.p1  ORF type:complete len:311 (-),score=78.73 TRINITY_DN778005_c0_g1_i1:230-1162(-)
MSRPPGRRRSGTEFDIDIGDLDNLDDFDDDEPYIPQKKSRPQKKQIETDPAKKNLSQKHISIMSDLSQFRIKRTTTESSMSEAEAEAKKLEDEQGRRDKMRFKAQIMRSQQHSKRGKSGIDSEIVVKILLLGDSGVGKTSVLHRFTQNEFIPTLISTAGVDTSFRIVKINGKTVKIQLWDTAGQERFHTITRAYYSGVQGIMLMYDISEKDQRSFENVNYWMRQIQDHATPQVEKIFIGNKLDIPGRAVERAKGQEVADKYNVKFFETSAKTGQNVEQAILHIAKKIINRQATAGADVPDDDAKKKCIIM